MEVWPHWHWADAVEEVVRMPIVTGVADEAGLRIVKAEVVKGDALKKRVR